MIRKLLLVDYENVQQVDLALLDPQFQVMIFVGASQKSIPTELVTQAHNLGNRLEWRPMEANGKNALDFLIAYELGRIAERESQAGSETKSQTEYIILSRDKGFDPLLNHLRKDGFQCRRIDSLMKLIPKLECQADDPHYKRAFEILGKLNKKSRPRKRKTLSQHILSIFQNKIEQREVDRIVDTLISKKLISETNNALTYRF